MENEQDDNPVYQELKPLIINIKKSAKRKKVLVAINTLTSINDGPYRDHAMLFYRLGRNFPRIDFGQMVGKRMSIDRFRNTAAKVAITQDFDYVLFIDDDMLFESPRDIFKMLYKANIDIISAFTYIRGYPFKIMSFKEVKIDGHIHLDNLNEDDLNPDNPKMRKDGVLMCDAIGTAVSLIKTSVLRAVPSPWFVTGPRNTEDIYFCCKAKDVMKNVKIGMHTRAITGHLLEPEVISVHTRSHLRAYYESYMSPEEIKEHNRSQLDSGDRGQDYVDQEVTPILDQLITPINQPETDKCSEDSEIGSGSEYLNEAAKLGSLDPAIEEVKIVA